MSILQQILTTLAAKVKKQKKQKKHKPRLDLSALQVIIDQDKQRREMNQIQEDLAEMFLALESGYSKLV